MVCFENYRELVSAMCDQNTEILISLTVCTHNNEWAIKIKACPLIRKESLDGFRVAYAAVQRMFFRKEILKGNLESDYSQRIDRVYKAWHAGVLLNAQTASVISDL